MNYRLILRNPPYAYDLPDWVTPIAYCLDRFDLFLICTLEAGIEPEEAIAALTQLGLDVWALEFKNSGWVSVKL